MIARRAGLFLGLGTVLPAAGARAFPARPIRLLVPVSAGSVPDILARLLAERLAPAWGVPVVVENRPGASGAIGVEAAMRAPADGHTLLLGSSGPIAILPAVNRRLPYDPLRDLVPVARVADFPLVFIAAPDAGFSSLAGLIARGRAPGAPLDYAGGDLGSTQHLSGALLAMRGGLNLRHIPYRSALAQADLMSGRIPLMVDSLSAVLRLIQDGRVVPLATCGARRAVQLPGVPAVREAVPGYEATGWMGVFAPPATPPEIVQALSAAVLEVLADPAMAARITAAGSDPAAQGSAAFRNFVAEELAKWKGLAEAASISVE
ncbi:Bug family tripartite tricarboxylate transporter substrate binding protein [Roseococcus sp. YIM B11640]|uniref:Bug family tripartite tricarboxylate transporter substrate binding protein n=1 Tax=Roseococcus sp. YIM B11640 TaxID=3133973 RepID=UPI003C7A71C8